MTMVVVESPKCGNVFAVDEADYVCILQQVKTAEFDAKLTRCLGARSTAVHADESMV